MIRPNRHTSLSIALSAVCVGGLIFACSDDPHLRTDPGQANATGGACQAAPGELPAPNCDNSRKECEPIAGCSIDETACGSASTCLPSATNAGKSTLDLRIRRLNVAAPAALAAPFIQKTIVTNGIDFNAPQCGEGGKGLFTWLLRVDRNANTLVTGGAPPSNDPLGKGFCFANFDAAGNLVEPVTLPIQFEGDTFKTLEKKKLNVPIFLSSELSSVVVLPITDVTVERVALSADGNCIGGFNKDALAANCSDNPDVCSKWNTAGSLGGYITLEEADNVFIKDLNRTLCVVLSQGSPGPDLKCIRENGQIAFKGDYCSTTKQPGGCQDSSWMAATFAAAAVTIFDGANGSADGCAGGSVGTVDAGADGAVGDSGSSDDASTDAEADATPDAN